MLELNARLPDGPIEEKWSRHVDGLRLVGPRNRPRYRILVVGSGLAGASAAASLAAMGYRVDCFCFQDSPLRRTASLRREGSTRPRTIATTATRSGGCSPTRRRGETFVRGRRTSTASPN